ncbi:hypothetical protein ACWGS9_09115 [Bradyrhizobium sp. Arg314]
MLLAALGITHPLAFFGPFMSIGIGNGLTMPAANMGATSVRSDLAGTATGLAAAMSLGGGAVVASIAGTFFEEAREALLATMCVAALLALLAAVYAAVLDRRATIGA